MKKMRRDVLARGGVVPHQAMHKIKLRKYTIPKTHKDKIRSTKRRTNLPHMCRLCETHQNRSVPYLIINFVSVSAMHQANYIATINYFAISPKYEVFVKIKRHKSKLSTRQNK